MWLLPHKVSGRELLRRIESSPVIFLESDFKSRRHGNGLKNIPGYVAFATQSLRPRALTAIWSRPNHIFHYWLIQQAREWSKNHPRVCGFYHTKSQAESSYGELNQAKLYFCPGQDVLGKTSWEMAKHPAYLEVCGEYLIWTWSGHNKKTKKHKNKKKQKTKNKKQK